MDAPKVSTPKKVWTGIALMAAAVAVPVVGYFRSRTMSGDFQPIALILVTLAWGIVISAAGIVCAIIGARQKPRSLVTKAALAVAGLLSIPVVYLAIDLVRIITA